MIKLTATKYKNQLNSQRSIAYANNKRWDIKIKGKRSLPPGFSWEPGHLAAISEGETYSLLGEVIDYKLRDD